MKIFNRFFLFLYYIANPNAQNPNAYETAINEVVVPVLNRDTCNEWLDTLNVTDGMICAGYSVSIQASFFTVIVGKFSSHDFSVYSED